MPSAPSPPPNARSAYVVIGMHRSGTSALTGVLQSLGAQLPVNLMPADEHNPRGYFEPWRVAVFNDEFLRARGSAWDDPFAFPIAGLEDELEGPRMEAARALLKEEFGTAASALLKDPRISLLAPFWTTALRQEGYEPRFVVSVRHPLEVARSLQTRDGFTLQKGVLLWLGYMIAAERYSRGERRVFVAYDRLLSHWDAEARRIAQTLGERLSAQGEAGGLVSDTLRHHKAEQGLGELGEIGTAAEALHRWMTAAAGQGEPRSGDLAEATATYERLKDSLGWLVSPMARDLDQTRADLRFARQRAEMDKDLLGEEIARGREIARALEFERDSLAARPHRTSVDMARRPPGFVLLERLRDPDYRAGMVLVDPGFYLETYPDIAAAGLDPVEHYVTAGWREGRDPSASFSTTAYVQAYPVLQKAGESLAAHYARVGHLDWDPQRRRVAAAGPNLGAGPSYDEARAAIEAEFDAPFYFDLYYDVRAAGQDPLTHYLENGWREGRDPAPWFSTRGYLAEYPEVAEKGQNPFVHYLTEGREKGFEPRPQLGWRAAILENLPDMQARTAAAYALAPAIALAPGAALEDVLKRVRGPHLTVSHDNYAAVVGGVQLCIAREGEVVRASGRDHLHLFPTIRLPTVSEDANYPVSVLLNGTLVGSFASDEVFRVIPAALRRYGADSSLAVHSLLGHHPEKLTQILDACDASRRYFWVHDYAGVCAGYTLLRDEVEFCGAPPVDSSACRLCVFGERRRRHMEAHRHVIDRLALTVIAPSQSALEIWRDGEAPAGADQAVHSHAELRPTGSRARSEGPLRVAFLGLPLPHKGWPVFKRLAAALQQDARYSFHHLGDTPDPASTPEFHKVAVGPGRLDAMSAHVRDLQIDVAIVWSIWPETFCLTAREAVAGGARLIASSESGAAAEFARERPEGLVLDSEEALLEYFLSGTAVTDAPKETPSLYALELSGMTADFLDLQPQASAPC